ncbi:MAG: hypothetical protein U0790_03555, partial [Isosphaeraceae bacterium]
MPARIAFLAAFCLLLLVGPVPGRAPTAPPAEVAVPPPPSNIANYFPRTIPDWERGYRAGYTGPRFYPGYAGENNAFRWGYARAREDRRQHDEAVRRRLLLERYGDEGAVDAWFEGSRAGLNGREPSPPGVEKPNSYLAYMDGHAAGQEAKVTGEGMDGSAAAPPRGGDALRYAKEYVRHLNAATLHSDQYYLLLDAFNRNFELGDGDEPSLAESIARSRAALELLKELIRLHGLINQHAYLAFRLQPPLVAAMEAKAGEGLAAMSKMELESNRQALYRKAEELTAEARRLKAEPVTVPANFHAKARHQRELLQVLSLSLESDLVREAVGSGRLDTRGVEAGKFTAFARSWRDGQRREHEAWRAEFNEWLTTRLPRSYPSGDGPPADLADQARKGVARFLPPPVVEEQPATPASTPAGGDVSSSKPEARAPSADAGSGGLAGWLKRPLVWVGLVAGV